MNKYLRGLFIIINSIFLFLIIYLYIIDAQIKIEFKENLEWVFNERVLYPLLLIYSLISVGVFFKINYGNTSNKIEKTKKEIELLKLQKELEQLKSK